MKRIAIFILLIGVFEAAFSQYATPKAQQPKPNVDMFKYKSATLAWGLSFSLLVRGIGHYYLGNYRMGKSLLLADLLLGDGAIMLGLLEISPNDTDIRIPLFIIGMGLAVKTVIWFVDWISVLNSAHKIKAESKTGLSLGHSGKSSVNFSPDMQIFNINNSVHTAVGLNLRVSF